MHALLHRPTSRHPFDDNVSPCDYAAHLELLEGESTAEAGLEVVALRHGAHDGPQGTGSGSREGLLRLLLPCDATALLASSLVEPSAHAARTGIALPVLFEMRIGDLVVVSRHDDGRQVCGVAALEKGYDARKASGFIFFPAEKKIEKPIVALCFVGVAVCRWFLGPITCEKIGPKKKSRFQTAWSACPSASHEKEGKYDTLFHHHHHINITGNEKPTTRTRDGCAEV